MAIADGMMPPRRNWKINEYKVLINHGRAIYHPKSKRVIKAPQGYERIKDWFLKRQATVETATYGSEFVAAKTATEQIMDLRNTLRYLGVPILNMAHMFGDNKSVVMSSTIPQSILNKRHNML